MLSSLPHFPVLPNFLVSFPSLTSKSLQTVHRLPLLILLVLSKTSASLAQLPGLNCFEPDPAAGISKAVIVDDQPLAYTSQLLPSDTKTDAASQANQVLQNLDRALAAVSEELRADKTAALTGQPGMDD